MKSKSKTSTALRLTEPQRTILIAVYKASSAGLPGSLNYRPLKKLVELKLVTAARLDSPTSCMRRITITPKGRRHLGLP